MHPEEPSNEEELLKKWEPAIQKLVASALRSCGKSKDHGYREDLLQEGRLFLLKSRQTWDRNGGRGFKSYLHAILRKELAHKQNGICHVVRRGHTRQETLNHAHWVRRDRAMQGLPPLSDEELAKLLRRGKGLLRKDRLVNLSTEEPSSQDYAGDTPTTIGDTLSSPRDTHAMSEARVEVELMLRRAKTLLTKIEYSALVLSAEGKTSREIGLEIGRSHQGAINLLVKAKHKLRKHYGTSERFAA